MKRFYKETAVEPAGSGFRVLLDGKPMHLSIDQVVALLNSMSADDIEKIELMTTPPAKYDADGSAGGAVKVADSYIASAGCW